MRLFSKSAVRGKGYMFTSKSQSQKGIMATMFSLVALGALFAVNFQAFDLRADTTARMGAVGLLAMIFAIVGLVLSIMSIRETEKFQLFPRLSIVLSIMAVGGWGMILYLGNMI